MIAENKTKRELIGEIAEMRLQLEASKTYIEELKKSEARYRQLAEATPQELAMVNESLHYGISERRCAEREVLEKLHFLQALIDNIPTPIYYKDLNEIYQGCNKAYEVMLGQPKENIIGRIAYDIWPEELADIYHEMDNELLSHPGAQVFDSKVRFADGLIHFVNFHKATYEDLDGHLAGLVGVFIDITERKQAEEELRKSEREYRTIFETTGTATAIIEDDTTISLANEELAKLAGYSKEEIEGKKSWRDLIDPDEIERMLGYHFLRRINPNAAPRQYESSFLDRSGKVKRILSTVAMIPGTKKSVLSFLDITEHKQIEDALREREVQLTEITGNMQDIIMMIDAEGVIQYISPSYTSILGYATEDILGSPVFSIIHPDDLKRTMSAFMRAIKDPFKAKKVEHRCQHANGRYLWMESVGKAMLSEETAVGAVVCIRDITDRMQVEEELKKHRAHLEELVSIRTTALQEVNSILQLEIAERVRIEKARDQLIADLEQQANELSAANKELESFSYSVSHDLRSPLRIIDGYSQILEEDYSDRLDEDGRDNIKVIRQQCRHMGELINDLLELARINKAEMSHERVDLSILAESIMVELQQTQPERKVVFTASDAIYTYGDPLLLKVMLANLLGNAWKFTSRQEEARITFGVTIFEGRQVYCLQDNGAGFNMAYAGKLFGPFQRLHSQVEFPGTGIGLAIVQRIIHRHGGQIWAEAAVEKGAAFYFKLGDRIPGGDKHGEGNNVR